MIRVRFGNGTVLQYDQAVSAQINEHDWQLLSSTGATVATISKQAGCVMEFVSPSRIYNGLHTTEHLRNLLGELRNITNYYELSAVAALKRELTHFNARSRTWKQ